MNSQQFLRVPHALGGVVFALAVLIGGSPRLSAQEAGPYIVDRESSTVGFTISHFGVSEVYGEFREFTGSVSYHASPLSVDITGSVAVASIDTGIAARDRVLMRRPYFDQEQYPEITFRTLRIEDSAAGSSGEPMILVGELGIRSVVRELRLPLTVEAEASEAVTISLRGSFDRNDFGVRGGLGSAAIGDQVDLRIDLVARRPR